MTTTIYIIAGPLFLISIAAHIYVRLRLNPKNDPEFDDYYYEFEEQYPPYAKYNKWLKITFTAIVISALLLFIPIAF
jgi:type IV secretory pathway VirB3-like protein